jgi:Uma2 family endonuclease
VSPHDYLLGERDGAQRHAYLNGELVAMSGGSRAHNLLATRVARLLGNHLEGSPCRVYQSDMKVRVEAANRYYYPDVMVCCGPVEAEPDPYYETAPSLIVNVLSPRTAASNNPPAKPGAFRSLAPQRGLIAIDGGSVDAHRTTQTPQADSLQNSGSSVSSRNGGSLIGAQRVHDRPPEMSNCYYPPAKPGVSLS